MGFFQHTSDITLTRQRELSMTVTAYKYKKGLSQIFPQIQQCIMYKLCYESFEFLNYKKNLNYTIYLQNSDPATSQCFHTVKSTPLSTLDY